MSAVMVFIWSIVISFIITIIYKFLGDQKEMKRIKSDLKVYREKINECKKRQDTEEMNRYMNEMLKLSQKQLRINMKPMFISSILFLIFLTWMSGAYADVQANLLGFTLNWFWIYFITVIPCTIIFRKIMKVY